MRPTGTPALIHRPPKARLGALDEMVALLLCHGVDRRHDKLAGRASEIAAADLQAVDRDIHGVAPVHSSMVTTSTSPASSLSGCLANSDRWLIATLPEIISVTTRCGCLTAPRMPSRPVLMRTIT